VNGPLPVIAPPWVLVRSMAVRAIAAPVSFDSSAAPANVTGFAAVDPSESSPAAGQVSVAGDGGA